MSAKQLAILIPQQEFDTSIGPITLKPFPFKEWNKIFDVIDRYKDSFVGKNFIYKDEEGNEEVRTSYFPVMSVILQKAGENYRFLTDLLDVISLCSEVSPERLGDLNYDEIGSLVSEIIDQNNDFFRRLLAGPGTGGTAKTPKADPTETPESQKIGQNESAA